MKKQHAFTAIIEREKDGYTALCPELDIASQGDSVEEARKNLVEAIELFFEAPSQKASSSLPFFPMEYACTNSRGEYYKCSGDGFYQNNQLQSQDFLLAFQIGQKVDVARSHLCRGRRSLCS